VLKPSGVQISSSPQIKDRLSRLPSSDEKYVIGLDYETLTGRALLVRLSQLRIFSSAQSKTLVLALDPTKKFINSQSVRWGF